MELFERDEISQFKVSDISTSNITYTIMANTTADQPSNGGDPMEGMTHSEVHYFNSYNHHGIHEEMLVSDSTLCVICKDRVLIVAAER